MLGKQVLEVAEFGDQGIIFDVCLNLLMVDVHATGHFCFLLVVKEVVLDFHPRRAIAVQLPLKGQVRLCFQGASICVGLKLMVTVLLILALMLVIQVLCYYSFAHVETHRDSCLILSAFPPKGFTGMRG